MATFTDTIRFVVEAVTGGAERNLKGLRSELAQTEGAGGKLKAGIGQVGSFISQNIALGAAGAGAAVTAFVAKAVGEFQSLALAADKFAAASGLAVEDASRWIEVAGDIGIEVGTIEGAVIKLNRAAGQGKLKDLGIETEDANERLLLVIEYLDSIEDETQRAVEAQKLLGKSWTELAPLIESSETLRDTLAEVADSKVIDPEEVEKAKRYREAMDNFNDALEGMSAELAEDVIPLLTTMAGILTNILELAQTIERGGGLAGMLGFDVPDWLRPLIPFTDPTREEVINEEAQGVVSNAVRAPRGTPGTSTTINVYQPPSTDGREVDRALADYYKRNGGAP